MELTVFRELSEFPVSFPSLDWLLGHKEDVAAISGSFSFSYHCTLASGRKG